MMKHPINVLLVMTDSTGFYGRIPDKPKIEINRHRRSRIILSTMFGQRFAVDEIPYLSTRDLSYECMPPGNASIAGVKDVVFFPIGFRTEGPPGSCIQCRANAAPAPIWQILEIQLAVARVHRRLQRANRVEALYKLIPTGAVRRHINKANPSGVCALQVFALVTNLCLMGIGPGTVGRRDHAQQTIASVILIGRK